MCVTCIYICTQIFVSKIAGVIYHIVRSFHSDIHIINKAHTLYVRHLTSHLLLVGPTAGFRNNFWGFQNQSPTWWLVCVLRFSSDMFIKKDYWAAKTSYTCISNFNSILYTVVQHVQSKLLSALLTSCFIVAK